MSALVTPIGDRVLILPDAQPQEHHGIILPENLSEKPQTGTVLAVGPGLVNQDGSRTAPTVSDGDMVLFSRYGGIDVELAGTRYLVMREMDLLGVVDRAALEVESALVGRGA